VNLFIEDVDKNVDDAMYIAAVNGFKGISEFIHHNLTYIDNVSVTMNEIMINSTVNNTPVNISNSTRLARWVYSVQNISHRFKINFTMTDMKIKVVQTDAWIVNVSLEANATAIDIGGDIGWNFSVSKHVLVNIGNSSIPDPMWLKESWQNCDDDAGCEPKINGWFEKNITKSPYGTGLLPSYTDFWWNETFAPFGDYDFNVRVGALVNHTAGNYYLRNTKAPGFFQRFEGRTDCTDPDNTAECIDMGIESFVNFTNVQDWWYSENGAQTCVVDYQFFIHTCGGLQYKYINMTNTFVLNAVDESDYGLRKIRITP